MTELMKKNLTILSTIELGFTWESGKTEVGTYQYLNQFAHAVILNAEEGTAASRKGPCS